VPPLPLRFGVVLLPEDRWAVMRERWQAAERYGFDHAWTYDHLTWRMFRDSPWFGAIPTLTAAALATTRIRLGTLVASPNFRHPVPFAKEVMTLDDIAGGRITLGIGAGGEGWDATALGQAAWSARERADRFEEFVTLLDRLLVQPETTYEGRFYSADEARALPGCVQQPRVPFAIAAGGPRGMRLAAALGRTWVTLDGLGAGREQLERVLGFCEEAGRDPAMLDRLVLTGFTRNPIGSVAEFEDVAAGYAEAGFTDFVVHWPREGKPFPGDRGTFERIVAEVVEPAVAARRT
jgi:alkanesulfonate monooxygenase SsuD/methylene tetrahydromethanopterin reductase-like flavin-dependent oxidoreductase (luciferase family)